MLNSSKLQLCLIAAALPAYPAVPVQQPAPGSLQHAYESISLKVSHDDQGRFTSANAKHDFTVSYSSQQSTIRTHRGSLAMRVGGYGRTSNLQAPPEAVLIARANKLELRRGGLTEFYVNDDAGLEHGFTVAKRPAGAGPLAVSLTANGDFEPRTETAKTLVLAHAGQSSLRYSGLRAWDSAARALPAAVSVTGRNVMLQVDDAGAAYPITINRTLENSASAARSSRQPFGPSVAVSGDTAVIGASAENGLRGAAYVFQKKGDNWIQQTRIALPNGSPNDGFGASVALSGDTILISAAGNNGRGAGYVYTRSGESWSEQAQLTASDASAGAFLGHALAIKGDTAILTSEGSASNQETAYVFARSGGVWTQKSKIPAPAGPADEAVSALAAEPYNAPATGASQARGWQEVSSLFRRTSAQFGSAWNQTVPQGASRTRVVDDTLTASRQVADVVVTRSATGISELWPGTSLLTVNVGIALLLAVAGCLILFVPRRPRVAAWTVTRHPHEPASTPSDRIPPAA